ncbi:MAG: hypothetical protein EXS18_00135 [Verrucomicrobiae bacterium]|nr:hypothetical protein [Verrucomicrobiae bacterium]
MEAGDFKFQELTPLLTGFILVPGWMAACLSGAAGLEVLDPSRWTRFEDMEDGIVNFLMLSANVFMILSPFLMYRARPRTVRICYFLFFLPVISVLGPSFGSMLSSDIRPEHLLVGYHLWALSIIAAFLLVAACSTATQFENSKSGSSIQGSL